MKTFAERLEWARRQAGFETAQAASDRFGWNRNTYKSHDNGIRAASRGPNQETVQKYARAFRVEWVWLMTGAGSPDLKKVAKAEANNSNLPPYIDEINDNDYIQVSIGDLRRVAVRALRRGHVSEGQALAAAGALVEALAARSDASFVLHLAGQDRKAAGSQKIEPDGQ